MLGSASVEKIIYVKKAKNTIGRGGPAKFEQSLRVLAD
jgi:hypothetical protein